MMHAGRSITPPPKPPVPPSVAVTMDDRLSAFLNHLLSWEGLASIATIAGIIAAQLAGAHLSAQWIGTAITVLTLVNVIGSKVAAAMGQGALTTVLKVNGKLNGGNS